MRRIIDGITLVCTCGACPEQYDAYHADRKVGYLRLRYGCFSVSVPDYGGEIIYEAEPDGDGLFASDERERYLLEAVAAIKKHLAKERQCA